LGRERGGKGKGRGREGKGKEEKKGGRGVFLIGVGGIDAPASINLTFFTRVTEFQRN